MYIPTTEVALLQTTSAPPLHVALHAETFCIRQQVRLNGQRPFIATLLRVDADAVVLVLQLMRSEENKSL